MLLGRFYIIELSQFYRPLWLLIVTLGLQAFLAEAGVIFTLELAFIPMNT